MPKTVSQKTDHLGPDLTLLCLCLPIYKMGLMHFANAGVFLRLSSFSGGGVGREIEEDRRNKGSDLASGILLLNLSNTALCPVFANGKCFCLSASVNLAELW